MTHVMNTNAQVVDSFHCYLVLSVILVLILAGCAPDTPTELGSGSELRACTYDAAIWSRRCRSAPEGLREACAALDDTWPERAALRLDLSASEHGVTPSGLPELTLAMGPYSGTSLRELLAEAEATEAPDPRLRAAVSAASRSFDGCADIGIAVNIDQLRVCGQDRQVTGAAGGACHALDDECGRGAFDIDRGCCDLLPRPNGVRCADGAGRCDGSCGCQPPTRQECRTPEWA